VKIAFCTPVYDSTKGRFARDLARLVCHTARAKPDWEMEFFYLRGSLLPYSRNALVAQALQWGADAIFWQDADHGFPPESLIALEAHALPIVGANYLGRAERLEDALPAAVGLDGQRLWSTREKAGAGEVEEVVQLGLGLCLMRMSVLDDLRRALGRDIWPLFDTDMNPDPARGLRGEDRWFFDKLRENGIKAYVDHALSMKVGHIADTRLEFPG
jgi:hypothetical protein